MRSFAIHSAAATGSVVLLAALCACQTQKSEHPLSPSVAGPIPGVDISAPGIVSPVPNFKFRDSDQPIRLTIQNATTTGVRPLSYTFEVASDSGYSTKVFSRAQVAPGNGQTSVQIDPLDLDHTYYWRSRAEDGANTGPWQLAAFEVMPKPAVNPPAAVSPINNEQVSSATPVLRVHNASFVGPVGALSYEFQVASDQAFTQVSSAGIVLEGPGDTTFNSTALAASKSFFWRARASDGQNSSAWTTTQTFRTPAIAPPPPPPPPNGAACTSSSPLSLVQCERAKFGHMSAGDTVTFLKNLARSLTANHISGAPFGILRKAGGTNCNGYACDIICTGSGQGQHQWDVLGDSDGAQTPSWNGPSGYPNIRIDVCEIQ
jgi:hypothetical protein